MRQKVTSHNPLECGVPGCEMCGHNIMFELPPEIVHACHTGNLVIFAGAGVSTETRGVYPASFYRKIRADLEVMDDKISFSKLMSQYCASKSRKNLLLEIKNRIDYVKGFPELYDRVVEFHRELSTIYYIDEIFTTNWDDFFERECDAVPIVTAQDFAIFQDIPGRKVFKLHGSIYNYGSIVATEEDYRKCYQELNRGIIGAKLKMHLLSKTIVFVGFSFQDEDFQRIYRVLSKEVKGMMPSVYFVTLDDKAGEEIKSLGIKAIPIVTSAVFFVKRLKKQLVDDKLVLPDTIFHGLQGAFDRVMEEHGKLSPLKLRDYPDALYSLFYQDGLQHAFERIMAVRHSGEYSNFERVVNVVRSYDVIIRQKLHEGNYPDVAYFKGYQTGIAYLLFDKESRKSMPMYFLFGMGDILEYSEFLHAVKDASKYHKAAHKLAEKLVNRIESDKLLFHHTPFL